MRQTIRSRRRITAAALTGLASVCALVSGGPAAAAMENRVLAVQVERLEEINGDHDGILDPNETAQLVLRLSNKSAQKRFSGYAVRAHAADPTVDSIDNAVQYLPPLLPGAEVVLAPMTIHVNAAAHRAGPSVACLDPGPAGACSNFVVVPGGCASAADCARTFTQDYSARIRLELVPEIPPRPLPYYLVSNLVPDSLAFDLDLDAVHPSQATTTFAEGFENGFGAFQWQNLDQNIATNSASNGTRCQYNDPDFPNSNSYGDTECYLGFVNGQAPVNSWHVHTTAQPDGGRAFTGTRAMHYGVHPSSNPADDTYGLSQMDGLRVRTAVPLNLARTICRDDPAANPRACAVDADCAPAGGGPCVPARPTLSFHHQVALLDSRCTGTPSGMTADRAILAAQVVGSTTWQKIFPSRNVYDSIASDFFSNCTFDPTDDGNTEDAYFDPSDPLRRYGPSSMCYPEYAFDNLGATAGPFAAGDVGHASDGSGEAGSLGVGTWVESRFDLSRYRGRSILVRFLITSLKASDSATYRIVYGAVIGACDDGWYLDDVQVTQTLGTTATTVSVDPHDNSALPGAVDSDGDGRPDDFDCAPADPTAFAVPPDVFFVSMAADKQTFGWVASAAPYSGTGAVYDVLRGSIGEWPVGSGAGESCAAAGVAGGSAAVPGDPPVGAGYYYLVRARNGCGASSYGRASDGSVRASAACP